METVKETKEHRIFKKKSGRYAVKDGKGKWVKGDDKVKILVAEKLMKKVEPKKKEAPAAEATEEKAPENT